MNLVIDIGNSRIKCALFEHHELLSLHRFLHTELDQLELWLASIQYDRSLLSTVVSTQDERVRRIISLTQPLILDSSLPLPIHINYHSSDTLGPDRIAAACGAAHLYPESNVLIINAAPALLMISLRSMVDLKVAILLLGCTCVGRPCINLRPGFLW